MEDGLAERAWDRHGDNVQLYFESSRRLQKAVSYPVLAPNGSSVLVCGHSAGLSLVWTGGRPFRSAPNAKFLDGSVMSIDSVNDEDHDAFADEEEEYDPSRPVDKVISAQEVSFGAGVVDLAVLSDLPKNCSRLPESSVPGLLTKSALVAVACADKKLRLVTFDLQPSQSGRWQFQAQVIKSVESYHRSLLRKIAFTTCQADAFGYSLNATTAGSSIWKLLIATHSVDPLPIVVTSEVVVDDGALDLSNTAHQTHVYQMRSPLISLSFNSSTTSKSSFLSLLAADVSGNVAIGHLTQQHRSGPGGNDTVLSSKWQISLKAPFTEVKSPAEVGSETLRRQRILDAQWVAQGRCVAVLLEDGAWGLWDIEAAGSYPKGSAAGFIGGSATTKFALRGRLNARISPQKSSSGRQQDQRLESLDPQQKLAPMTPNTRKVKQSNLFSRATQPLPSSRSIEGAITTAGDSLCFSYDSSVYIINDFHLYWRRAISRAGELVDPTTLRGDNTSAIDSIVVGGQTIKHISQMLSVETQHDGELIVTTEYGVIIRCKAKSGPPQASLDDSDSAMQGYAANGHDTDLLNLSVSSRNELDLDDIDRALDSMHGSTSLAPRRHHHVADTHNSLFDPPTRASRRVGFAT